VTSRGSACAGAGPPPPMPGGDERTRRHAAGVIAVWALVITEQLSDTQLAPGALYPELLHRHHQPASGAKLPEGDLLPCAHGSALPQWGVSRGSWTGSRPSTPITSAINERKIYRGLVLEETLPTQFQRNPDNWLRWPKSARDRHAASQRLHALRSWPRCAATWTLPMPSSRAIAASRSQSPHSTAPP
jgi:hypothetical protein